MPIDTTPRPAPPRKKTAAAAQPRAKTAGALAEARAESIDGFFQVITLGCIMRGRYADAGAFAVHGPRITPEIVTLAAADEKIGNLVDYLTQAGPYMGLTVVMLPLVMQLLVNHGRLDADAMPPESGIVPAALLERKIKADLLASRKTLEDEISAAEKTAQNGSAP